MKRPLSFHLIWLVPVLALVYLAGGFRTPKDKAGEMRIQDFGKLPVVFQGRVKPYDTLARNSLIVISDKQSFRDDDGKKRPAIEWLVDVVCNTKASYEHKVFRIPNLNVLSVLGLERRKGFRYSFNEFQGRIRALEEQARQVQAIPPDERDAYGAAVFETLGRIQYFNRLVDSHLIPPVRKESAKEDIQRIIAYYDELRRSPLPHAIPPYGNETEWRPYLESALIAFAADEPHPALAPFTRILVAGQKGDIAAFNGALDDYNEWLAANPPEGLDTMGAETTYNSFQAFYRCSVLYVFAFLLGCFSWLGAGRYTRQAAFLLLSLTFLVHTGAIAARIHISGYPPVTNLYGSAIFIGWGCVGIGLLLERIFKLGIGNLVAAVTGFLTLLIAHFLGLDGDTMEMMQAVLDTKFWLATHVVTVTLGYTATYFAGFIAILFVLRGLFTRSLTKPIETALAKMIYGVVCFALLLSFVGTVLGGLWADDSWGRFWGWDPKENGALIIVLWNAIILHARWCGMIRNRGLAIMAMFGNIVTSWSWFGVNQLGIGLHTYGFTDSVTFWLLTFVAAQLGLIGLGLIPREKWRSSPANLAAAEAEEASKAQEHPDPLEGLSGTATAGSKP